MTLLITTALPAVGTMNIQLNGENEATTLAPILKYSPTSHDFGYVQEGNKYQTTFDIWNDGTGTLDWHLGIVHPWISPTPFSGSSTGEHDTVTVTIDTTDLSPGSYEGFVSIYSNGGDASFEIELTIKKGRTKDIIGLERDYKTHIVTMSRNKANINTPFLNILQNFLTNHPNMFPILQRLIFLRLGQ